MKKTIGIIAICASLIGAFAFTNYQTTPQWPNGISTPLTIAVTGTTALTISNKMNHVASVPTLTANATVSLTAATGLKAGAIVSLAVKTTSTETTTFAGAIVAPVVTGVVGKTWAQSFIYNGTYFYPCGAKIQVD